MIENILSFVLFVGVIYGGYRLFNWYDNREPRNGTFDDDDTGSNDQR